MGINIHSFYLALYGLACLTLVFLYWLLSWRFGWKPAHPIVHSGLRWWKETIGASLCVLLWLYLLVALAAWPTREHAKQVVRERLQKGDWVFLRQYQNTSPSFR